MSKHVLRWRSNPASRLHWRHWRQDYILFNAASGQTHVLNELGACALRLLHENAMTAEELVERLAAEYELAADLQLITTVHKLLLNLDELGLIEPCAV